MALNMLKLKKDKFLSLVVVAMLLTSMFAGVIPANAGQIASSNVITSQPGGVVSTPSTVQANSGGTASSGGNTNGLSAGDTSHSSGGGATSQNISVQPQLTHNTSLTVDNATGTYGGTVSLTATLTHNSNGVSGETISFTLNGTSEGTATTNSSGVATLNNVSLAGIGVGTHYGYIGASFAGDSNYSSSSDTANLTVTKASTSLSVASATGTYGGTVSLTATLTSNSNGVNGETISFTLNGTSEGTATTNNSGVATLNNVSLTGISVGTHNGYIGASFAGDSNYSSSSDTANLTVTKASTSLSVASATGTYGGTVS